MSKLALETQSTYQSYKSCRFGDVSPQKMAELEKQGIDFFRHPIHLFINCTTVSLPVPFNYPGRVTIIGQLVAPEPQALQSRRVEIFPDRPNLLLRIEAYAKGEVQDRSLVDTTEILLQLARSEALSPDIFIRLADIYLEGKTDLCFGKHRLHSLFLDLVEEGLETEDAIQKFVDILAVHQLPAKDPDALVYNNLSCQHAKILSFLEKSLDKYKENQIYRDNLMFLYVAFAQFRVIRDPSQADRDVQIDYLERALKLCPKSVSDERARNGTRVYDVMRPARNLAEAYMYKGRSYVNEHVNFATGIMYVGSLSLDSALQAIKFIEKCLSADLELDSDSLDYNQKILMELYIILAQGNPRKWTLDPKQIETYLQRVLVLKPYLEETVPRYASKETFKALHKETQNMHKTAQALLTALKRNQESHHDKSEQS